MEIWAIIEEEHEKLKDLAARIASSDLRGGDGIMSFKQELTAHTEAEAKEVYPTFLSIGGFEDVVAHAVEHDRQLRGMTEEIDGARDPLRFHEIEVALAHHIEHEQSYMLPLARRRLPYHTAEHMKHRFEAAKHNALTKPKRSYFESDTGAAEMGTVVDVSGATRPGRRSGATVKILERILVREHDSLFVDDVAVDRLLEPSHRSLVGELAEGHLRRTHELDKMLSAMDVMPRHGKDAKWLPGWTRVSFASLIGDKAVLQAVRSNEERSRRAYERMCAENPPAVADGILQRLVQEERDYSKHVRAALRRL